MDEEFYSLTINRQSLIDEERGIAGFAVDAHAMVSMPALKATLAYHIESAIENCEVIFGDLKRTNHKGSFCYCASPPAGAFTNYVFLVFAMKDAKLNRVVVFQWGLRRADPKYPGWPANCEVDLGEPKWRREA